MKMNVQPIPNVADRINEIRSLTATIVNKEILPNENMLWAWRGDPRVTDHYLARLQLFLARTPYHETP